jgi:hypothetical protein
VEFRLVRDHRRPVMKRNRLCWTLLALSLVLSSFLLGAASNPARAQTTLEFKEETVSLQLMPPGFATAKRCQRSNENGWHVTKLGQSRRDWKWQTARATVFVTNGGDDAKLTGLEFRAKVQNEQVDLSSLANLGFYRFYNPHTKPVRVRVCSNENRIEENDTKPFDLWIELESPTELSKLESWTFSGYLLVSAQEEGVDPAATKLKLVDTDAFHKSLFNLVLLLACIVASGLGAIVYYKKYKGERELGSKLRTRLVLSSDWKESWASKITAAGGILGTILAASVLPEATFLLAKEQYVALNLLFVLLIALAVLVHNVRQRARTYLFAGVVTFGAVSGQIITAILLFEEIGIQGTMTPLGVRLVQVLIVIVWLWLVVTAYKYLDPPAGAARGHAPDPKPIP